MWKRALIAVLASLTMVGGPIWAALLPCCCVEPTPAAATAKSCCQTHSPQPNRESPPHCPVSGEPAGCCVTATPASARTEARVEAEATDQQASQAFAPPAVLPDAPAPRLADLSCAQARRSPEPAVSILYCIWRN